MSPTAPAAVRDRLRIAIQKNGRLAGPARTLLSACGLAWREDRDGLFCHGETLPVDLLLVRDDDIPGLLAEGACDFGVVGRNVLQEAVLERSGDARPCPREAREYRPLGFGGCRLMLAVPQGWTWNGPSQLAGLRIASSHPRLLRRWLDAQRIDAQVVTLSGSVEIAPRLGQADAVCDLVSSGATLAANQLLPVCDLHRLLGEEHHTLARGARVLVYNSDRVPAGFLVDEVSGYRQFTPADQRPELAHEAGPLQPYVLGGFVREAQPWLAVSLHKIAAGDAFNRAGW